MSYIFDVAVIGSGPAGFNAAIRAAHLGAQTVLIEKSLVGGVCINCGCIPTKFLWQALKTKQKIQKSYEYGFKTVLEPFSFAAVADKKDKALLNIRKGAELILSSHKIKVVKAQALFKDKNTLVLDGKEELKAAKFIIASGTVAACLKGRSFGSGNIISPSDFLNLKEIPKTVLIIGGGAIGVEAASILAGFGARVAIAEYENRLLPNEDAEISEEIKKNLQRQGVEVLLSCKDALESADKYDKVLIAAGRVPQDLSFANAGVQTDAKGFVKTDAYCRTNVENIYAAGDIAGKNLLAYTAQNEGSAAAENAVKNGLIKIDDCIIPQSVFSMPACASVKIKNYENYKNVIFGKIPFTASARAFIENERTGFIKCAVDKESKKPLAFWVVGAHSDEIINCAAQIVKLGIIPSRENFFHPSFSENIFNAYEAAFGISSEMPKKQN
ncbi:MAG: NAD(P)/FAD-dependent oxidoreductase [Endomicrobium sp.]|jgi:dihydrolipoamide dehydrogenase|nr:NAD(P)/FAD-dependent oxidoreductase [Endomicrobium sp.]